MSRVSRLWRLSLLLLALGAVIAALWIYLVGGPEQLAPLLKIDPRFILPLLCLTGFCLLARFVRWHFLLRRAGVRVPVRPSLTTFLASLVGSATPAYVGEAARAVLLRRKFGSPLRLTLTVLVLERLLDVVTLAAIGAWLGPGGWVRAVMLLLLVLAALGGALGTRLARRLGVPASSLAALRQPGALSIALVISFTAWVPASLLVGLVAAGMTVTLPLAPGMGVFSTSTLLGSATLMPAGVGATGSFAILQLQGLGIALAEAVVIVSLVRLTTTGAALAVGLLFLMVEAMRARRARVAPPAYHFDDIALQYGAQFAPHIWDHLLERKIGLIGAALPEPAATSLGLDLGCGLGEQCLAMRGRGYRVVGVDVAHGLVRQARARGAVVSTASALELPFRDASFDFVYSVGVLHHLEGRELQQTACREVARVLKPAGLLLVHETNPRNLLFRFYMGYVFPMVKSIDMGTEWWIEPRRWAAVPSLELVGVQYFTFIPDFLPRRLMRPFLALERLLETSRARPYSAHYLAVLRKQAHAEVGRSADELRGSQGVAFTAG